MANQGPYVKKGSRVKIRVLQNVFEGVVEGWDDSQHPPLLQIKVPDLNDEEFELSAAEIEGIVAP